jgi:hypothetical protein
MEYAYLNNILAEVHGNSAEAELLYAERFPNHQKAICSTFLHGLATAGNGNISKKCSGL